MSSNYGIVFQSIPECIVCMVGFGYANYYATKNYNASQTHLAWTVVMMIAPLETSFYLHKLSIAPLEASFYLHTLLIVPLETSFYLHKLFPQLLCA